MKTKRFWIAAVGVFVVCLVYEFIVHGWLLNNWYYKNMTQVVRSYPWLATIAPYVCILLFAFFFTLIFSKGVEGKGWVKEGFNYGVVVWGLTSLAESIGMYKWAALPARLLLWWIFFGFVECVILGWVCAFLYGKEAKTA